MTAEHERKKKYIYKQKKYIFYTTTRLGTE